MDKKWYESKTIWFGLFTGISGVVVAIKPDLVEWMNEGVFAIVWSVVSLFLRSKTDKAISA